MPVFCMNLEKYFILPIIIAGAIVLEGCVKNNGNKISDGQNYSAADRSMDFLVPKKAADEYSAAEISCSMIRTEQRISDDGYIMEDAEYENCIKRQMKKR